MKPLLFLFVLIFGLLPSGLMAAQEPILRMDLEETETIPGQSVLLRLTVLVPTWMAKPPVYPSFEVPNVMVRIPQKGSFATSETIDGETWSGISRSYRIYPMTAGTFDIPEREIELNYAEPGSPDPTRVVLKTEPLRIKGVVPAGAEGLLPFIAAEDLTLDETLEGEIENLAPGDAFTRSLTTTVKGVAPMVLPPLIEPKPQPGLSSYGAQPVLTETENRGVLSGKRQERVTYVAENGGRYQIPEVRLEWFNLSTHKVEIATLDGFELAVRGDLPAAPRQETNWRAVSFWAVFASLVVVAMVLLFRFGRPAILAMRTRQRAAWVASREYAFQQARAAIHARDLDATMRWIALWQNRSSAGPGQLTMTDIRDSLTALGADLYGRDRHPPKGQRWDTLLKLLEKARNEARSAAKDGVKCNTLPPLNPGAPA
ncbi:MAG: hypothetical protein ABJN26_14080 [Stappiaceae bacterium]